ncbi:AAA family ATPase [Marinitoga lauensis]|uniref:AAA family ATPase n=1 Tax=Marinitoga lauensis TaxID=2201189 RepID=UPI0010128764|nr:ATP-binding protein [Marinitoga lauensis]
MLIDFNFYNFKSFADETEFSMIADDKEAKNSFNAEKFKLLKTAAIYGPNAGGKSNVFKAFKFYIDLILKSAKFEPTFEIPDERFKLNKRFLNEPTIFECRFIIDNVYYRYGFSIKEGIIESEWLYYRPKGREARIFERDGQKFTRGRFNEGKGVEEKTKENTLFLSSLAQWNSQTAIKIMKFFQNVNFISTDFPLLIALDFIEKGIINKEEFLNMLKNADMGISDFKTKKIEIKIGEEVPLSINDMGIISTKNKKIYSNKIITYHPFFDENNNFLENIEFDFLKEESEGTKKYFGILGPILATLKNGSILFIDELDTRIHPLLLKTIIELFHSEKNKKNAQLIFTTHNTLILNSELFSRDQIWFVSKDKYGKSELYSLLEIKG